MVLSTNLSKLFLARSKLSVLFFAFPNRWPILIFLDLSLEVTTHSVLCLDPIQLLLFFGSKCFWSFLWSSDTEWRRNCGTGSFSMAPMNFLKWGKYSGNISRLQWLPPLSHKGSYFSLASSHNCFPCEISTTLSSVPCITRIGHNILVIIILI